VTAPPSRSLDAERLFDERAQWYDDAHDSGRVDGHALRARMAKVVELVGAGPGAVVDVGMGPGRLLDALAGRGWAVSGVDVSARMVDLARLRLPAAGERLVRAPAERLPFDDSSFDVAVATGVLEYVTEPQAALAEVARVLRPGGRFVGSIPNPWALHVVSKRIYYPAVALARSLGRGRIPAPGPRRWIARATLPTLLAGAGLELERTAYTSYAAAPTPLDLVLAGPSVRAAEWLERRQAGGPLLATQLVFLATRPR
jgi:SAM-dependent methyltransferase